MNKIQQLIQQYCPNGVEFKELGEVCEVLRGKRLTKKELSEDGSYPVFHGGLIPLGRYDEFNRKANQTMVINTGSVGEVVWSGVDFWSSDGTFVVKTPDDIEDKFLYYFLKTQEPYLKSQRRDGGVPTIDRQAVEKIQIPIPPLPIQQEIVTILDSFTQLEAELEAELEARRAQYKYYRDKLLSASEVNGKCLINGVEVEWKTLGEISKNITSGGTPSTSKTEYYNGEIPWLRTQEVDWVDIYDTSIKITEAGLKNSSAKLIPPNCVIVAMYGATAAKVGINKIPLTTNQACSNLEIDDNQANYRYVFHWLCKEYQNLKSLGEGSQSNINGQKVKNYKIPIPPLAEQERIVGILDKFDALVNDISIGLPAEIDGRCKQYNYYRRKLLDFKCISNG